MYTICVVRTPSVWNENGSRKWSCGFRRVVVVPPVDCIGQVASRTDCAILFSTPVEHFSAELHHALESDVSDLSASVLEDNAEMDNTYDDDAGSSESASSIVSPLYTPASAKSLSVQSGAGAVQDVSTDDATQRGQSSANPRPPNGRVRMSLDIPTVATSTVSMKEPGSVNLFIQVETAEDASVFDETSIGSATVEYSDVPKDVLLQEIFEQLPSDCQLLSKITRFGPASGFFEMVYRGDSWVDAGRGIVSLQLPVGSFEYSMQGVPSGRVQLLFRATPFRLKKAAVSVPVFRNKNHGNPMSFDIVVGDFRVMTCECLLGIPALCDMHGVIDCRAGLMDYVDTDGNVQIFGKNRSNVSDLDGYVSAIARAGVRRPLIRVAVFPHE
eukprot:COSAG02_NODE_3598_length_6507_cov_15.869538_9_plen_385_part_00